MTLDERPRPPEAQTGQTPSAHASVMDALTGSKTSSALVCTACGRRENDPDFECGGAYGPPRRRPTPTY